MRTLLYSFCIAAFFLHSCKNESKGKVIGKEAMQAVMWDMLQAEAFTQEFIKKDSIGKDSLENASLQKKIFQLHHITKDDFDASYRYYTSEPAQMKVILDSITAKAERERTKMMTERYSKPKTLLKETK